VLGHEIAHVSARHVADQSARLELERHGLVAVTTGGNLTGLAGDFIGTAILLGANSRQAEIEADQLGMQYMSQAGYDPMEMVSIIKMLDRTNHSLAAPDAGDTLPEWLITHPSPDRRIDALLRKRQELASAGTRIERDSYLARVDGLAYGPDVRPGFLKKRRFVAPGRGYQVTFPPDWLVSSVGTVVHGESQTHDAMLDLRAREEPTADSAARTFFHKQAKLRGVLAREQVGAVTLVQGQLSWMPYWVKVRGSVAFIESRGTVYQLLGLTTNGRWDDYGQLIEGALRTVELVPDSVVARAQPLRVATRSLREATSLSALVRLEGAPVGSEEMAMLNQVSADSVLPPGQIVKWIESPVH
jgi:predicted Zn-dependent protease